MDGEGSFCSVEPRGRDLHQSPRLAVCRFNPGDISRGAAECNSLGREPQEPIQNDILAAERRYTPTPTFRCIAAPRLRGQFRFESWGSRPRLLHSAAPRLVNRQTASRGHYEEQKRHKNANIIKTDFAQAKPTLACANEAKSAGI